MNKLAFFAITAVGVIITSYILKVFLTTTLGKCMRKSGLINEDFSISKHFQFSITLFLILFGLRPMLMVANLNKSILNMADKFWQVGIIIVSVYFFIKLTGLGKIIILNKLDTTINDNIRQRKILTQMDFIERIIGIIFVLIGICAVLMSFDGVRKIGASIIASAGLAGIVVGLAAQKTISNLIAGFQIAFTQPFRINDVVIVDGEWGWIEEITLTYVVIRIWDKRRLIVPITYLLEKPFQNWSRNSTEILGYFYIYADYTVPVESIRSEFMKLLKENDLWDKDVAKVEVTNLSDKSQEIRILVSAENSSKSWELKCYLRENLIRFIQEHFPEGLPKQRVTYEECQVLKLKSGLMQRFDVKPCYH